MLLHLATIFHVLLLLCTFCRLFVRNLHFSRFAVDQTKIKVTSAYFDGLNWTVFEALVDDPGPVHIVCVFRGGRYATALCSGSGACAEPALCALHGAAMLAPWPRLLQQQHCSLVNNTANTFFAEQGSSGLPRCSVALCRINLKTTNYIDMRWQRQLAGGELGECHHVACLPQCLCTGSPQKMSLWV